VGSNNHYTIHVLLHLNFPWRILIDNTNPNEMMILFVLVNFRHSTDEPIQVNYLVATSNKLVVAVNRCPPIKLFHSINLIQNPHVL